MKKKQIIFIIFVIICILFASIIIFININKNLSNEQSTIDSSSNIITDDNMINYDCIKEDDWSDSVSSTEPDYSYGKYRFTYDFSYSILDNEFFNMKYAIKIEFSTIESYNNLSIQSDSYIEKLDEQNLIKTYTTTNSSPDFGVSSSDIKDLSTVSDLLGNQGYSCTIEN